MDFFTAEVLVVLLCFSLLLFIILPLHRRYLNAIFIIEGYLNTIYDITGECELFYDVVSNIKSPYYIAFRGGEVQGLHDCVHDHDFLNESLKMINNATREELNSTPETANDK